MAISGKVPSGVARAGPDGRGDPDVSGWVLEAYASGESIREVSRQTGWSRARVRRALLAAGFEPRSFDAPDPPTSWWRRLTSSGMSLNEAADLLGCSVMTVRRRLRTHGLWTPAPSETFADWLARHSTRRGACLVWLAGTKGGHPVAYWRGATVLAHRLVWEHDRGPIPDGHDLVRTDDCDEPRCVAPEHRTPVRTGDRVRALADAGAFPRGERHWNAQLTEEQARRVLGSPLGTDELASQLGVTPGTIRAIRAGRTWRHLRE